MALSGARRDDSWTHGHGLFMKVARQGLVFDTLTEVAADGTLQGELASGWSSSGDARIWLFDLRSDVVFHDGAPFTAADVVASAAGFADGVVAATGTHQVSFTLTHSDPGLPMRLSQPEFYIAAAHAPGTGIGTGLYQVTHFTPGQRLLAQRSAQHYKDNAGWFEEVELTSIPSEDVRAQALGEYLVDAVDVHHPHSFASHPDIALLPSRHTPMQAVSTDVQQPRQISKLRPLDNLRAAERWWFA